MPRVIAGSVKGFGLVTPEGMDTRPTTDRIKETLFNMIQFDISDALVIDFFAGSGAIGIEALSRGARHVYFADHSREAVKCIEANLKHTHMEDKATVFATDCVRAAHMINEKQADFIFMDPPYGKGLETELLASLLKCSYVTEDTVIIVEVDIKDDLSGVESLGYSIVREKEYKTNKHVFLARK